MRNSPEAFCHLQAVRAELCGFEARWDRSEEFSHCSIAVQFSIWQFNFGPILDWRNCQFAHLRVLVVRSHAPRLRGAYLRRSTPLLIPCQIEDHPLYKT